MSDRLLSGFRVTQVAAYFQALGLYGVDSARPSQACAAVSVCPKTPWNRARL